MTQETKPKNIKQANKKLVDIMSFGLSHGVESVRIKGKGPLVPFVVLEFNGERDVTKFFTNDPDDGLRHGIRFLKGEKKSQLAVLVYSGQLTFAGQKFEAVIVKGFDRSDTVGYSAGQRYLPKKFMSSFKLIGNRTFMGNVEQILT